MASVAPLQPGVVRRAAAIARGPHPCPSCESPTWAEPPVPWTDLRDYVVRCDSCERPVLIRVDRDRVLRRGAVPAHLRVAAGTDAVDELLDTRGARAFVLRLLAASLLPATCLALALAVGATVPAAIVIAAVGVIPGALWAPALVAGAVDSVRGTTRAWRARVARALRRAAPAGTIEVERGRWDQWQREEKLRARERAEHPDAVLRELERVLDERELRRVRMLAERGEVPAEHLDDLLRYRRPWAAEVDESDLPEFVRTA